MHPPTLTPPWLRALLLAGALLLSACTFVTVQNQSESDARVRLQMPDRTTPIMIHVQAGSEVSKITSTGGSYTVSILPADAYDNALAEAKAKLEASLFDPNKPVDAEAAKTIAADILELNKRIDALAAGLPTCSSTVEELSTALVQVTRRNGSDWDQPVCNPGIAETEDSPIGP